MIIHCFGVTAKPFLSGKGSQYSQLHLVDQDNVISLSKGLGSFFDTAV